MIFYVLNKKMPNVKTCAVLAQAEAKGSYIFYVLLLASLEAGPRFQSFASYLYRCTVHSAVYLINAPTNVHFFFCGAAAQRGPWPPHS